MKALILFSLVAFTQAISFFDLVNEEWNLFKLQHKKVYADQSEERLRMKIFIENKKKVAKHNAQYEKGLKTYKLALNHYADLLHHEFLKFNGFNKSLNTHNKEILGATFIPPAHVQLPDHVDWRQNGAVTPVKDQGQCGSCWAFSTTGSLEGQHFRKTGKLVSLSEQNLIDCSSVYGNNGCNGGLMDNAFKYIQDNRGIDTEISYPYEAEDDQCRYKKREAGATDTGFVDVSEGNEHALKSAVAVIGPVSIAIDASQESFRFYSEGVYYEPLCSSTDLDHGVLVVGYGTTDEGHDYWIVKNSWSEKWGEGGYIKMARNRKNNCGIATSASYPLV